MANDVQTAVYTDFNGLAALRRDAKQDPKGSLQAVAKQFEAIFMQMVLKSMRDASMGDGLFDSEQSGMYRDMFDSQISLSLAEKGGLGIADAMVRQLGRNLPDAGKADASAKENVTGRLAATLLRTTDAAAEPLLGADSTQPLVALADPKAGAASASGTDAKPWFDQPLQFVQAIWDHAKTAAAALGIAPEVLVAQAALETGWGQHILSRDDGGSSNNLFGIKADNSWNGDKVAAQTLEFRDGVMAQERAAFRAYPSLGDSFSDYVRFLKTNPRYQSAVGAGDTQGFVNGLQRAGYATDPGYASKIRNIVDGDTLRDALGALNL